MAAGHVNGIDLFLCLLFRSHLHDHLLGLSHLSVSQYTWRLYPGLAVILVDIIISQTPRLSLFETHGRVF